MYTHLVPLVQKGLTSRSTQVTIGSDKAHYNPLRSYLILTDNIHYINNIRFIQILHETIRSSLFSCVITLFYYSSETNDTQQPQSPSSISAPASTTTTTRQQSLFNCYGFQLFSSRQRSPVLMVLSH